MIGVISSTKMTGVVTVLVEQIKIHPLYGKRLRRSKKFLAATAEKLNVGDSVEIKEVRPQSRRVRFSVIKVNSRVEVLPEVKADETAKAKQAPVQKAPVKKAPVNKVPEEKKA